MLKVLIPAFARSGTSFLTGLITRMGFHPGPEEGLQKANQYNPFGFYENLRLQYIAVDILKRLGGDYVWNIPDITPGWHKDKCWDEDKKNIQKFIDWHKIEIFKNGQLLMIADLFDELYPDAQWIVTRRDIRETYESRGGKPMPFAQWEEINRKREQLWRQTNPYKKALNLNYHDFFVDLEGTISRVAEHLGVQLTDDQWRACIQWFMPGRREKKESNQKTE